MRRRGWVPTTWIGLGLLLALAAFLAPTHALAAPQPCTEAGLDAALAAGGMQTFSCALGTTITISGTKYVGQNVTLDGGGAYQVFSLGYNTVTFGVANLTAGATRKRGSFPEHKTVNNVISTRIGENRANTRGSRR